jgi:predicted secreted protein
MNLKGQNLRVFHGSTVIAMATNCSITLTNNTDESSTKDVVGMASQPTVISQGWQVQVDSLKVSDIGSLLTSIKNNTKFLLMWDETATSDNYTAQGAGYARQGYAYLNELTVNFNDRENSAKNLSFTGDGALAKIASQPATGGGESQVFTKGQFVRLFLGSDNTATPSKVIASAKQLSLHISMQIEDATTKDTEGNWLIQEPVALSYDISTTALVKSDETITSQVSAQDLSSIEDIYEAATPVKWAIANVSGANQRTKGSVICSGSAIVTQLQISAQNRANATYQASLNGFGTYNVGA